MTYDQPDLTHLKLLLQVLREGEVTSFKTPTLELSLSYTQPTQQPTSLVEFPDETPSEEELLFAASGFRPTE